MAKLNIKAIDFDSWGGLDNFLLQTSNGATTRGSVLKAIVPWLAKAVAMTSNAVSGLPFEIVNQSGDVIDTSTDWSNALGGIESPRRLMSLIAGALCGGSAYLIPVRTSRRLVSLQYVAPHTIEPYITYNGLEYFNRTTDKGQFVKMSPDELIYFWLPDSDVEIGRPLTSPMSSALIASELLASMSSTMKIYGDRGFVPAYIGSVKGMPSKDEKQKAENYLTRFLRGAYDSVVKLINSESMSLIRVGAGMEELKGAYTEIQQQAIEDIGTAFGIPAALFMSDKSFASEVDSLTRTWYETGTFVTIYQTIEETFNAQLFKQYGARMQFKPETLSVFQDDENERAGAVTSYTNAIISSPKIAKFVMSFMGVDLDQAQEEELDAIISDTEAEAEEEPETEEDIAPAPMAQPDEEAEPDEPLTLDETKELTLWYSKAKAWSLKGKGFAVDWECKHLRQPIAEAIRVKLADAKNELDIVKAFEIGKMTKSPAHDDAAMKALASALDRAVQSAVKVEPPQIQPAPVYNMTMPAISLTTQMPPSGTVTVNVPEQPAPVVNVTTPENIINVGQPVTNVTVQPADVVIPPMPMEATITTDKATGKKTLKVT